MKAPEGKYAWTATVGEKGQIVIQRTNRNTETGAGYLRDQARRYSASSWR